MRSTLVFAAILVALSPAARAAEPAPASVAEVDSLVRGLLVAKPTFTVAWREPEAYPADAETELAQGVGHGGTLSWIRVRPERDRVHMLALAFSEKRTRYDPRKKDRWRREDCDVKFGESTMTKASYGLLLRGLAMIGSATLTERSPEDHRWMSSSADFLASVRLVRGAEPLLTEEYAGYRSTTDEIRYAKAEAMKSLVWRFLEANEIEAHDLDADDRAWASAKLRRDWPQQKDSFFWWVRESELQLVGFAGDRAALPVLEEALAGGARTDRPIYYAINAITRILGEDVRPKPGEDVDLAATCEKVRALIRKQAR